MFLFAIAVVATADPWADSRAKLLSTVHFETTVNTNTKKTISVRPVFFGYNHSEQNFVGRPSLKEENSPLSVEQKQVDFHFRSQI